MSKPTFTEPRYHLVLIFVTSLFLLWGMAITMGDVLNKHFQNVLQVSKANSGLVQFSIFGAYAIMGIPAGLFMKRFGYKKGVIFGLSLYALGAFLFVPAANAESFDFFRIALFILACGLATLETVAHPFVSALGDQRTSDQRINFAQAFNGLGAVIGPLMGGYFILHAVPGDSGLDSVKELYVWIGLVITAIAIAFSFVRVPSTVYEAHGPDASDTGNDAGSLFQFSHFKWAVVAQFFNVAAQGGTWAFFINYSVENNPGMSDQGAAYFFSLSMVMMMVGRFISTYLMRFVAPNRLLAIYAVINCVLCVLIAQRLGPISFIALIMLNFFLSIMFPTIFSLGLKGLGKHTQQASSYIVMGVVGGALFPPIMGLVADIDMAAAYYLPIICYAVIFAYGIKYYKVRNSARA